MAGMKGLDVEQMNPPARESHVSAEFSCLQMAVDDISKATSIIESRLEAVLRPIGPGVAEKEREKPEEGLVPLADGMRQMRRKISQSTERLASVLQRLEL
jgi:hypothetical protein